MADNRGIAYMQGGFTLIETVIAVAIVATAFFALISLHLQTINVSNSIRFYTKAPLLAQEKLSELDANLGDLNDSEGEFSDDYAGYTYKVKVTEDEYEILGETAKKVKKIDLQIVLNEGENYYDLTIYRYVENDD